MRISARRGSAFKGAGTELKRMVLKDKLGQTVQLDFLTSERNVPVADAEVSIHAAGGRRRDRHARCREAAGMNLHALLVGPGLRAGVAVVIVVCLVPDQRTARRRSK